MLLLSTSPAGRPFAIGFVVLAIMTDLLDGLLARKLNQVTELGKIVDPLADKIGMGVVALVLTSLGRLPLWFLLIVLVRDGLIFLGGMYVKKVKGIILQSNLVGKLAVAVVAALMFVIILDIEELSRLATLLTCLGVLLLILSFLSYAIRCFKIVSFNPQSPIVNPKSPIPNPKS